MPKRIISLVPSLTELLFDLGLMDGVIGRTRFCIHPAEKVQNVDIIGGTKNPRIDKIRDLKPDLVIANKEENRKEDVEAIQEFSEVIVTDISTIEDALFAMHHIANRVNADEKGTKLIEQILSILPEPNRFSEINAAYFMWKDPWMSVGGDTYIHDVMQTFGLRNVFQDSERYPTITLDQLKSANPELILLSSEPYPFKEKHIAELKEILPNSNIQLVDGEWFSWYGSRMLPSFKELSKWRNQLSI
ncbi:MAG: ABC transporter substrate-binding protein [Balneolaceae bacterium]|nr:ABC transporter substrate-binding protein [Balneolaceae bacterium]